MPKKPSTPLGIETYHYTGGIYLPAGISCKHIDFLESTTEGETVNRVHVLNKTFPGLPVQLAIFPDPYRAHVPIRRQTFPPHMQILPQQMTWCPPIARFRCELQRLCPRAAISFVTLGMAAARAMVT